MPAPFLTLHDLILPPPLPALAAVLLVAGAAGIAGVVLRGLAGARPSIPRRAAAFIVIVAICGAIVNGLAMAHVASLMALRLIAAGLIAAGVMALRHTPKPAFQICLRAWRAATFIERAGLFAIASAVFFLGLAACGPVTDPDSLDYHLGVPLDWLRHGGVTTQAHWLHARLTGLGEAINMLGLAAGTDCLGAVVQVSGLIAVMAAIAASGKTLRDRLFGLLLSLPPALLPLTTAQKPQLFPAAAVAIAMILALSADSILDFALVFGCVAFAMACKYSFVASGGVVVAVALFHAHKRGKLGAATGWAAICFAAFVLPLLGRNWHLYGDPVSPFLEGLRLHADPEVTRFAVYLGNVGGPHTLDGVLSFLPHILLPAGPGGIQTFLGIGVLAVLLTGGAEGSTALTAGFAVVLLFTLWRGQMAPRYLLEAYFWCAAGAVAAPWSKLKSLLLYGLTAQTLGVAAMAFFAAAILFPGALTPALRERVMRRSTFGYQQALWMDRAAPPGATIMVDSRAYALFPRPFVIPACASCGAAPLFDLVGREDLGLPGLVLFPQYPVEGNLPSGCHGTPIAGPESFPYATRSPAFKTPVYQVVALRLDCK